MIDWRRLLFAPEESGKRLNSEEEEEGKGRGMFSLLQISDGSEGEKGGRGRESPVAAAVSEET